MASISRSKVESQPSLDANHPPLSYTFPKRPFGKKNVAHRSCHAEWFKSWSWLHALWARQGYCSSIYRHIGVPSFMYLLYNFMLRAVSWQLKKTKVNFFPRFAWYGHCCVLFILCTGPLFNCFRHPYKYCGLTPSLPLYTDCWLANKFWSIQGQLFLWLNETFAGFVDSWPWNFGGGGE